MMKKVLIITYYFPPRGGIAVIRMVKFVKYLREFGWEPIVLTVKHNHYAFRDDLLLQEIPENMQIYYTKQPLIQHLIRYAQSKGQNKTAPSSEIKLSRRKGNSIYLFIRNVKNKLNEIVFLYDDYIGWRRIVLKKMKEIIKENQIDLIFTSSRPYTVNVIGNQLAKKHNIPWVADFRDPWTQDERYFHPPTFFHKYKNEKEEKKTVTLAQKVISVSAPITEFFQQRYPFIDSKKFLTITNGFDGTICEKTDKNDFKDKFVITYTGTFYLHQTPVWFFQAVKLFLDQIPEAKNFLLIQLVGKSQKNYETYPHEIGIDASIKKIGFVPHQNVIHYLINSDVLLLVLHSDPTEYDFVFSGKFFEYLPARKPILATINQGVCKDFIKKYDLGVVVPFSDVEKIKDALIELFLQWKQGRFKYKLMNNANLIQFHRKELTRNLATVFDQVINSRNSI